MFGPILTGAAFLVALLGPVYAPGVPVQINAVWLVVLTLAAMTVLLTAVNMVATARRMVGHRLPRTRFAVVGDDEDGLSSASLTLVLEPTELLGFNMLVTVYYNEELEPGLGTVFERLIGVGRVSNVQQNGLVQVLILQEASACKELWQRIRRREISAIKHVVVKPSIPFNEAGVEVRFHG